MEKFSNYLLNIWFVQDAVDLSLMLEDQQYSMRAGLIGWEEPNSDESGWRKKRNVVMIAREGIRTKGLQLLELLEYAFRLLERSQGTERERQKSWIKGA